MADLYTHHYPHFYLWKFIVVTLGQSLYEN